MPEFEISTAKQEDFALWLHRRRAVETAIAEAYGGSAASYLVDGEEMLVAVDQPDRFSRSEIVLTVPDSKIAKDLEFAGIISLSKKESHI